METGATLIGCASHVGHVAGAAVLVIATDGVVVGSHDLLQSHPLYADLHAFGRWRRKPLRARAQR